MKPWQLMIKLRMKNYNMILIEKLQKYNRAIIKQAKFTYFPLGKVFEKQTKTIQDQREKRRWCFKSFKEEGQTRSTKGIFPKYHESDETKNELHKIKRYESKVIRDN